MPIGDNSKLIPSQANQKLTADAIREMKTQQQFVDGQDVAAELAANSSTFSLKNV